MANDTVRICVKPGTTVLGTTYYDNAMLDCSPALAESLIARGVATTTTTTSAEIATETRRKALMTARTEAIARRDWQAMNEITKRLAKLPMKGEK